MEIGVGEYEIDVDRLRFRYPIAWLVLFGDISSPKIAAALLSSPYAPVSRSSSTSPTFHSHKDGIFGLGTITHFP
ncbi:hypothetical protein L2E82_25776 [Cichorium intybus]|uniref:Uncharacterized protein n=1 Tax=Cichorium intybus TaxID=13427 RepID=A0ACB9E4V1_CICIN|nr:hypothetical protein L2E82_50233 [Cichorium intybus]KAI3753715.1 hypothetical protein L2E82_25776 [Cichorium intybus]